MTTQPLADIAHLDYTQQELQDAFDLVADPTDWRAPIDRILWGLTPDDKGAIAAAVEYFTATQVHFVPWANEATHVLATGYRFGPAGDH